MPPRKRPEKLLDLCKSFINYYIIKLIVYIQRQHGDGSLTSNTKLKLIQDHLSTNLLPSMMDELLKSVDTSKFLTESVKLMILKVYMHRDMVNFQAAFRLPNADSFYELQLIDLKKLVTVNLRMVCTDEILEVIGKNCPLLESVDIVSKIGSESNKTRNQLNALKLKFYVSDEGLSHLHNCTKLKRIIMNTIIRSNCGGRKITHDGIRGLLTSLPNLQYINYSDMGFVLESFDRNYTLNLLQLHDNHTNPDHIRLFAEHCPKLKHLCLVLPTTNSDINMPESCLDSMAKSDLNLFSLALGMFPVGQNFVNYLKVKGNFLTSLCLVHNSTITLNVIMMVNKYCSNLKHLEVCRLVPNNEQCHENVKKSFKNLLTLKIVGTRWDPYIILPLCLFDSPRLEEIILVNEHYDKHVDDIFVALMNKNNLSCVKNLSILDGFIITLDTLVKLVLRCENVSTIKLSPSCGYEEYLNVIKVENNLDFTVSAESVRNFADCLC